MPYKIVRTIEKGKPVLTTIPSNWEKDGLLFWPRLPPMKVDKLRRVENSKPDYEDWKVLDCTVKRTSLITFDSAESEINKMCDNSETETDNEKENISTINTNQWRFNNIVEECLNDTVPETTLVPTEIIEIQDLQNNHVTISDNFPTNTDMLLTKINESIETVQSNQSVLQDNINTIIENQKTLFEGQQNMMRQLSATVTQFEEYVKKSSEITKNTESIDFQVIKNNEQLHHLEQLLHESKNETEFKKKLSTVCGKGKGRGINNAYALIDVMFDRHFLKTCSWAGGSRTTEPKICFKSFTKIIKLFFEIIYDSDNSFTLNECNLFLKNILKNSGQRCNSKMIRTSATKHRPKTNKKVKIGTSNTTTSKSTTVGINKASDEADLVTNKSCVVNLDVAEIFV